MRTRAERRHHRHRILAHRRDIATVVYRQPPDLPEPAPQVRHWHFRCNCFEDCRQRRADLNRERRAAIARELSAD